MVRNLDSEMICLLRSDIRKQNAHYIKLTSMGLLDEKDYLISNEFPTKANFIDYQRYFTFQRRKWPESIGDILGEDEDIKGARDIVQKYKESRKDD